MASKGHLDAGEQNIFILRGDSGGRGRGAGDCGVDPAAALECGVRETNQPADIGIEPPVQPTDHAVALCAEVAASAKPLKAFGSMSEFARSAPPIAMRPNRQRASQTVWPA